MVLKFIYSLLLIVLFFVGLSRLFGIGGDSLELMSSRLLYPFLKVQDALSHAITRYEDGRQSYQNVLSDLQKSQEERDRLQQKIIQLSALINYKENTKDMRDFLERYNPACVRLVQILLRQFGSTHFYLVDTGSIQGITKDMVAVYKDCLVGRVIEVYPYYSKVLLITDPACKVTAVCAETGIKGIHEGAKQLDTTKLTYVDHLAELKNDDLVISSGEGMLFPRGFGLGRIKTWDHDGFNYSVTITPLIDLKKIEYCCIIQQSTELKEAKTPEEEGQLVPQDQKTLS